MFLISSAIFPFCSILTLTARVTVSQVVTVKYEAVIKERKHDVDLHNFWQISNRLENLEDAAIALLTDMTQKQKNRSCFHLGQEGVQIPAVSVPGCWSCVILIMQQSELRHDDCRSDRKLREIMMGQPVVCLYWLYPDNARLAAMVIDLTGTQTKKVSPLDGSRFSDEMGKARGLWRSSAFRSALMIGRQVDKSDTALCQGFTTI